MAASSKHRFRTGSSSSAIPDGRYDDVIALLRAELRRVTKRDDTVTSRQGSPL